jgi:hypothetical protein
MSPRGLRRRSLARPSRADTTRSRNDTQRTCDQDKRRTEGPKLAQRKLRLEIGDRLNTYWAALLPKSSQTRPRRAPNAWIRSPEEEAGWHKQSERKEHDARFATVPNKPKFFSPASQYRPFSTFEPRVLRERLTQATVGENKEKPEKEKRNMERKGGRSPTEEKSIGIPHCNQVLYTNSVAGYQCYSTLVPCSSNALRHRANSLLQKNMEPQQKKNQDKTSPCSSHLLEFMSRTF